MSRRRNGRTDYVADAIYGPFANNPSRNRAVTNERMYLRILAELSVNRFKWVGLPDTIDERFLELTLFHQALCVFYFDKDYDRYLALRAAGTGRVNMYDNPTTFTTIGNGNGQTNKTLKSRECVPIWANFLRVPDSDICYLYATKLAQVDRTIEINLKAMRHTSVLFVDENERQSYVNLMRQVDEGQPHIFGTPSLDLSKVQAFNLGIDKDQVPNLMLVKTRLWNECMTLLGINNANQDKKERLVSDEVAANNDQVVAARGVSLNARVMAAEQINRMFGLSVSVGWNPNADMLARAAAPMNVSV